MRLWRIFEACWPHAADDADNLAELAFVGRPDALADRIGAWKVPFNEGSVDDSHSGRIGAVAVRERSALEQRNPHCSKIAGCCPSQVGAIVLARRRVGTAFNANTETHQPLFTRKRQRRTSAGDGHAGQHADSLEGACRERRPDFRLVLRDRQVDLREQCAVGTKTGVHVREAHEASPEETGADHEREGQRDLDAHEDRPRTPRRASAGSIAAGLQRVVGRAVGGAPCRRETGDDRRCHGERQGSQQHAHVDADGCRSRQFDGRAGAKDLKPCPRQPETREPPETGDHGALNELLTRDPSAAGTERRAHRHLALAGNAARQQQAGDVGARNQEHAAYARQQHEQRPAHRADQAFVQRRYGHAPPFHRRVFSLDPRGNRAQDARGRLRRHARRQPADHVEIVCRALPRPQPLRQRHPHVHGTRRKIECGRHHADNRRRFSIQRDTTADSRRRASEPRLPELMADYDHR